MDKKLEQLKLVKLTFIEKVEETENTMTFKFEVPEGFNWTEGTHFHLAFKDFYEGEKPDKKKVRTFSIMSLEEEKYIGFTTRITKECSAYKKRLLELNPGDEMLMFKTGNRMMLRRENRPLVLISMGVGVATFRPLIKTFLQNKEGIKEVIQINIDSSENFLYKEELTRLEEEGFKNSFSPSRKDLYEQIDASIKREKPIYYVVGSDAFIKAICGYLRGQSVENGDIVIDKNPEKAKLFYE